MAQRRPGPRSKYSKYSGGLVLDGTTSYYGTTDDGTTHYGTTYYGGGLVLDEL